MVNGSGITIRFDARKLKSELNKTMEKKVRAVTKDHVIYKGLLQDYYSSKELYVAHIAEDSGAFAHGYKGVTSVKSNRKDVRYGRISYTTKGIVIDPVSVYERKRDGSEFKYHYGQRVLAEHPDLVPLLYDPYGPGWNSFVEKAKLRIVKGMNNVK